MLHLREREAIFSFGKKDSSAAPTDMQIHEYEDFDAFAGDVRDIDAVMMLQNPRRRRWTIGQLNLSGIHVQCGALGSGNIVEGQSWSSGYIFYLPLSTECEYRLNGARIGGGILWGFGTGFAVLPKHPRTCMTGVRCWSLPSRSCATMTCSGNRHGRKRRRAG